MKLIVITPPHSIANEPERITALFEEGLEILHLRKPAAMSHEIECLLKQLSPTYYSRIVLHDHFQLANTYGLKGIHLNRRNPHPPCDFVGSISCSCHSIAEVEQHKPLCNYVFLSPIYNSISKEGYLSAYSDEILKQAHISGIIDNKVCALGGISLIHLPQVHAWGFGGAAILGDLWEKKAENFILHFKELKETADNLS